MALSEEDQKRLPLTTVGVYAMVELGMNVRSFMTQQTYSRHRQLLKLVGYDPHERVLQIEKTANK